MKPYQPQGKNREDEQLSESNHMQTVKNVHKKSHIIDNVVQSRPQRTLSSQLNWIYKEQYDYIMIRLDITCFCQFTHKWLPNGGQIADILNIHVYHSLVPIKYFNKYAKCIESVKQANKSLILRSMTICKLYTDCGKLQKVIHVYMYH